MNLNVVKNEQLKGIEVYFDGKPDVKVLDVLKSNKFRWHSLKKCWYNKDTEENNKLIESLSNGTIEIKAYEAKKVEKVNIHGVKVGDIFVMSWGYDQTNVDYFQVVELKGSQMVKIREIASKFVRAASPMSGYVKPVKDAFLTYSLFTSDKKGEYNNNNGIFKKTLKMGDTIYLNMSSYANAYLTNENSEHFESSWA
jgi:hypothetical protein